MYCPEHKKTRTVEYKEVHYCWKCDCYYNSDGKKVSADRIATTWSAFAAGIGQFSRRELREAGKILGGLEKKTKK